MPLLLNTFGGSCVQILALHYLLQLLPDLQADILTLPCVMSRPHFPIPSPFLYPEVTQTVSGFSGLEVAYWPLVPKFAGSNPAEVIGFFRAKKILSTPSFGREVKPFVPCRRFAACKRSLNVTWKSGIFR